MTVKDYIPHAAIGAIGIAAALVVHFEGKSNVAYSDPPGIETICYGHAHGVEKGDIATDAQCAQYLEGDLDIADTAVKRLVKVPMTIQQEAAFADFAYNEGAGTFQKSSILRDFNAGMVKVACDDLHKFSCISVAAGTGDEDGICSNEKMDKKMLPGLVKRRQSEFELCILGVAK